MTGGSLIFGAYTLLVLLLTEAIVELNEAMEMVPMPAELVELVAAAMAADLALCWVVERVFAASFPARVSKTAMKLSSSSSSSPSSGCSRV